MALRLNHTIVWCRDKQTSAAFLTGVLGLPPSVRVVTAAGAHAGS